MTTSDTNTPGGDDEDKTDAPTGDSGQSNKFPVGAAQLSFEFQHHQCRELPPRHQWPSAHMLSKDTFPQPNVAGPSVPPPAHGQPINHQPLPWKPFAASHPSIQVPHEALSAYSSAASTANSRTRKRRRAYVLDDSGSPPAYEEADPIDLPGFRTPVSTSRDYVQAEVSAVLQESFKRIRMESGDRSPAWKNELMEIDRPLDADGQPVAKASMDRSFSSLCPYLQPRVLSIQPPPSSHASSPHALERSPVTDVPSAASQHQPAHHYRRIMISTRTNPDPEHYAATNLLLRTLHAAGRLSQQQQQQSHQHLPHASFDMRESEQLTEQTHATTRYAPINQLLRDLHLARYSG